ncbi:hypothetical protein HAALTHF_25010n [Vreelandella aquamarina]|nr:hypothetical protein HAALTHF_25010n [Halomonas axialensis]
MAVSRRVAILAATLAVKSFMMKILMLSDVYFPRVNGVPTSIESFRGRWNEDTQAEALVRLYHSLCPNAWGSSPA